MAQAFFAKYYDHFVLEELRNKKVNGDMLLQSFYQNYIRYGSKCVQQHVLTDCSVSLEAAKLEPHSVKELNNKMKPV